MGGKETTGKPVERPLLDARRAPPQVIERPKSNRSDGGVGGGEVDGGRDVGDRGGERETKEGI